MNSFSALVESFESKSTCCILIILRISYQVYRKTLIYIITVKGLWESKAAYIELIKLHLERETQVNSLAVTGSASNHPVAMLMMLIVALLLPGLA